MQSIKKALFYGVILWVIPFVVAMLFFRFRETNRALFESVMPVVIVASVVVLANLYFKIVKKDYMVIRDTIAGLYPSDHFPLYATFQWET